MFWFLNIIKFVENILIYPYLLPVDKHIKIIDGGRRCWSSFVVIDMQVIHILFVL